MAGPDVLTYGEMIERIAEAMGVGRMPLGLPRSLTPPASAVVAAVTGQPLELVRPLMESLETDMLPREPEEASRLYGIRPLGFDRAVDRALREWESARRWGRGEGRAHDTSRPRPRRSTTSSWTRAASRTG